jgi:hypothetical protein
MVAAPYKKHQNYVNKCVHIVHTQELNWVQIQSLIKKKKNKTHHRTFHLKKCTVTATKIDSSHESSKNFITWAWPASTTIIYNNSVLCLQYEDGPISST